MSLVHNDFEQDEIESLRTFATATAQRLIDTGAQYFEKITSGVKFMGVEVSIRVDTINDGWEWRLKAFVKTCAVSSNLVKKTRWEEIILEGRSVPNASTICKIPEAELWSIAACRDTLQTICMHCNTIQRSSRDEGRRQPLRCSTKPWTCSALGSVTGLFSSSCILSRSSGGCWDPTRLICTKK